jgi:hypothetical protein
LLAPECTAASKRRAATVVALLSVFAFGVRAEELEVTYTSSHAGAEIFEFNTLDGSYDGLGVDGQGEIVFPLSYDSQGNDSVTFAAPGVESNYPGTIIITCCATGFFDGVDPPIFTGGTTILTWLPGIYTGSYGTFTVALAPFHLGDDAGGLRRARLRSPATPGKRAAQLKPAAGAPDFMDLVIFIPLYQKMC